MKKTNIFAAATAMVMALASLPVVSASAGETFQPGDVDMDGVITGHDSAVVSRALYEEDTSLTAEQFALADVNGDGVVDQTDLEWIHGQEEYVIGDVFLEHYGWGTAQDALAVLYGSSWSSIGIQLDFTSNAEPIKNIFEMNALYNKYKETGTNTLLPFSQVQYNLMDVNGDCIVNMVDAHSLLFEDSRNCCGLPKMNENRYDLPTPYEWQAWLAER